VRALLEQAYASPVNRPVDPKKLARKPLYSAEQKLGRTTVSEKVSVPEPEELEVGSLGVSVVPAQDTQAATRHTEIEYNLLALGANMGFNACVAPNDRSRKWHGHVL